MCGILCILSLTKQTDIEDVCSKLEELLSRRGPNKCGYFNEDSIKLGGYVLWQQGVELTPQPLISEKNVLIFNGDIFNADKSVNTSDSAWLLNQIDTCDSDNDLMRIFRRIQGPYSLIIFNRITKSLYFGRDSLGRNSLLIAKNQNYIQISSTAIAKNDKKCKELPPIGIFKLNLNNFNDIHLYPWKNVTLEDLEELEIFLENKLSICEYINPVWMNLQNNPIHYFNFYEVISPLVKVNSSTDHHNFYQHLLSIPSISIVVDNLLQLLEKSVEDRIRTPSYCKSCLYKITNSVNNFEHLKCNHSKIGILFSGGLDCTILACLVNKIYCSRESIDLINVSFESCSNNKEIIDWNVPDRCSAKTSLAELQKLFPGRKWNLVEVNVTRNELEEELNGNLKNLIYPLETILDESLGSVFWFAAKGVGVSNNESYESNSRILLIGSGADELFGGYTRHRNAFLRTPGNRENKLNALQKELEFDWNRIPFRNLGRDDRVIGDNSKTSRSPYIEENFVCYVNSLRPEQKCCFDLEQGVGDKLLLRLCGHTLGLRFSSLLKKRAAQFGSRIANRKQNAQDVSKYLNIWQNK